MRLIRYPLRTDWPIYRKASLLFILLLILVTFWRIRRLLFYCLFKKNSYLSHRIIDCFQWITKWKIYNLKLVLLALRGLRPRPTKLVLILEIVFWYIVCKTMLYIIFQFGWEPVLNQRILIGFEAILELCTYISMNILSSCSLAIIINVCKCVDICVDNDIMPGKNCRQFRLRFPMSIIGQFVHPIRGGWSKGGNCDFIPLQVIIYTLIDTIWLNV